MNFIGTRMSRSVTTLGAVTGTRVAAGVPDALQHFDITPHPADLVRLAC
jgi:hypothetical protein